MIYKGVVYIMILFSTVSCIIADDYFANIETVPEQTLAQVVEDSIRGYLKQNENIEYLNYNFSDLSIQVPNALLEQEKWNDRIDDILYDQRNVIHKVKFYDSLVGANDYARMFMMTHVFSLKSHNDSIAEVSKIDFYLDENINVVNIKPLYNIKMNKEREKVFAMFYFEAPIIKGGSYEEGKALNYKFYSHFKSKLDSMKSYSEREFFLNKIIDIGLMIRNKNGEFNQQEVAEYFSKKYINSGNLDIDNYKGLKFSELYEISNDEKLSGYYIFHQLMHGNEKKMEVYIRLSPYFEVESIYQNNNNYFKN